MHLNNQCIGFLKSSCVFGFWYKKLYHTFCDIWMSFIIVCVMLSVLTARLFSPFLSIRFLYVLYISPCCSGAFCCYENPHNMLNDSIGEEKSMCVTEISWLWARVRAAFLDVSQTVWDAHGALDCLFWQAETHNTPHTHTHTHRLKNKHVLAHLMGEQRIQMKCKPEVCSSVQCSGMMGKKKGTCFIWQSHCCVPSWSSEGSGSLWRSCVN